MQTEDYIDDLLNGDYTDSLKYDSNSMSDVRIKEEPQHFGESDAKDRQKKDNHNMSKKCNFNARVEIQLKLISSRETPKVQHKRPNQGARYLVAKEQRIVLRDRARCSAQQRHDPQVIGGLYQVSETREQPAQEGDGATEEKTDGADSGELVQLWNLQSELTRFF